MGTTVCNGLLKIYCTLWWRTWYRQLIDRKPEQVDFSLHSEKHAHGKRSEDIFRKMKPQCHQHFFSNSACIHHRFCVLLVGERCKTEYYAVNPPFPPVALSPEYLFFVRLILTFLYIKVNPVHAENDSTYIVFHEEIVL